MKETEQTNYNIANFDADETIDKYIGHEIVNHLNCGCFQCRLKAENLAQDWMYKISPQDIAEFYK
jgi:hypothetical protein